MNGITLLTDYDFDYKRSRQESAESARDNLSNREPIPSRSDLSIGWYEAIRAGELIRTSEAVFRSTGKKPMKLEEYFSRLSERWQPLLQAKSQNPEDDR